MASLFADVDAGEDAVADVLTVGAAVLSVALAGFSSCVCATTVPMPMTSAAAMIAVTGIERRVLVVRISPSLSAISNYSGLLFSVIGIPSLRSR